MITESARKIFEIEVEEVTSWGKRPHKHSFFEIVYVERGSGIQCINQHEFDYQAGHIFLLPPLDCHSFKVKEPSRFYYIRFTDHYFLNEDGLTQHREWFDRIAYILANYNKVPGDIIASGTPKGVGAGRDPQEWMWPGDRVVACVEGIGMIEHHVVDGTPK